MSATTLTVRGVTEQWLADAHLDEAVDLDLGDCTIRVRAGGRDDAARRIREGLVDYFPSRLGSFDDADIEVIAIESDAPDPPIDLTVKQPDPGKTKIKEEFADLPDGRIVRKRLTGMLFAFGGGVNVGIGPALENLNQVINFINNRYIEWQLRRGCLLGHAAAVAAPAGRSEPGRGLALAGFSGAGKSTLALHLMARDLAFVSNDRLCVRYESGSAVMFGVPKQPRINPGTLLNDDVLADHADRELVESTRGLSNEELWTLEQKHDVIIEEVYGHDRFLLSAPMDGLVILNWQRTGEPADFREVEIATRRDLLPAFIKSPGLFYEPEGESQDFSEDAYVELLSTTRVFEVTGGVDFAAATDACMQVLEEGR